MDYIVRIGISSDLDKDKLQDAIDEALSDADILNTVYEVMEDDGKWVLAHMK
jgi:chromosome condensin MukBEF MukE localization factor